MLAALETVVPVFAVVALGYALGGPAGPEAAALMFVTIALLSAVFGIWIAKGESGLREALRLPLVYGAAGGFACALLFLWLLDAQGLDRYVLLLYSTMPPAVMNAVTAERYHADPALVASAITLGTLASVAAIPAVILFAG